MNFIAAIGIVAAVFNRQAFLSRCIWHGGWKPPPLFCGYTFSQNALGYYEKFDNHVDGIVAAVFNRQVFLF
jgi:hypothetical protein